MPRKGQDHTLPRCPVHCRNGLPPRRNRVSQTVLYGHLTPFDACFSEDIYGILRTSLLERVRDKETTVRVQAAVALSKLCGSEEDPREEPNNTEVMIDIMKYDTAA